eukprot:6724105-Heterocapsa_arctica.AAC.1
MGSSGVSGASSGGVAPSRSQAARASRRSRCCTATLASLSIASRSILAADVSSFGFGISFWDLSDGSLEQNLGGDSVECYMNC